MATLQVKPLTWLKPDPKQPRKNFNESDLRQLGESLKVRQIQPVLALPDGTIIAGERRYRAAKLVGLPTLEVIITDKALTDTEIRVIQLTENMQRADLTAFEKWQACAELMCMNPTWQMKDAADSLKLDPSSITRLLSPSKCTQAWQDALRDGKVGISDCYAASKLPENEQAGLLALKLSGASRDAIEQEGRKKRNGKATAVRLSRVKIAMPQGATVVISGNELSMPEVVELLSETLKEARKAAEQYDVKTWQAMMKDRAKAA